MTIFRPGWSILAARTSRSSTSPCSTHVSLLR
eukprot:CAMPEP_0118839056 /NCGR_PEP_ID=MMETSP1162-20130426/68265_1 /TAXON_ID=33656 /ORGANISM="Phaeocystis Sp, Strain CCMP2710" /LENGTH=31 /DNA_ID= /DNA_START= /DNA_END= /DNA_ORIENTATION=